MTPDTPYRMRPLPVALTSLGELVLDLRYCWNHSADSLWRLIDPDLWEATRNPWLLLQTVSRRRLDELAADPAFCMELERHAEARRRSLTNPSWFQTAHPKGLGTTVAYFSMEFGLSDALPIYSGGLGMLAGDHLKTASDLGIPLVGIGLLYQCGYFRQALDPSGEQLDLHPYNDPTQLPVIPLRDDDGEWVHVEVDLPGRSVRLRCWVVKVGRVRLFLLDSNDPMNSPFDRAITGELYGGGPELRLQQEIVLGIGGWRLLEALGIECGVCHLNEGHAALAVLERARSFMLKTGHSFAVALRCTRAGNLFTTHTPVEAGFDRFSQKLAARYLDNQAASLGVAVDDLLALGLEDPSNLNERFNMATLAVRGSFHINAVSRLHGEVSRRLFQPLFPRWPEKEVPIVHVTNGVHVPTWDAAAADDLWNCACGTDCWAGDLSNLETNLRRHSGSELWAMRNQARTALIPVVRSRVARQRSAYGAPANEVDACALLFDPQVLTIGFARRFATYKRPDLLLHDPERLVRILNHAERPVQLVVAGKAHPHDGAGRELVRQWAEFSARADVSDRAVFLQDYDMALGANLVQGVDVWLNTPRRPWEASGTSGMKVLVNGGLNLSELDGWWAEAYSASVGWALGDGQEHGEDPDWDAKEADDLYRLLEEEIAPSFYDRDEAEIPQRWVERMRDSMALLAPRFSSNRMVREYVEDHYQPCADAWLERSAEKGQRGVELEAWADSLRAHWHEVQILDVQVDASEGQWDFRVRIRTGRIDPNTLSVELYADPPMDDEPAIIPMSHHDRPSGTDREYLFMASVSNDRPNTDYTPRVIPRHPGAQIPLDAPQIRWRS